MHAPTPGRPELYVESGRQALTLIARWCRSRGIELALLPSYHCDSMALPFWLEGMRVHFVGVGNDLQFSPDALNSALANLDETAVVLWARVGAIAASPELAEALGRARRVGHLVVDDATHAVLDDEFSGRDQAPMPITDFRIASLRKLIPVTDGALLRCRPGITLDPPRERTCLDDDLVISRSTLLAKAASLNSATPLPLASSSGSGSGQHSPVPPRRAEGYLEQLSDSEGFFDRALTPVPMSRGARSQLSSFDLGRQARRERRANRLFAEELERQSSAHHAHDGTSRPPQTPGIGTIEVLNAGRACFPLIRTSAAAAVEEALVTRGLFSPQSWPRPDYLPSHLEWPSDVLSIDCGQSRTTEQIRQIAEIVYQASLSPAGDLPREHSPGH